MFIKYDSDAIAEKQKNDLDGMSDDEINSEIQSLKILIASEKRILLSLETKLVGSMEEKRKRDEINRVSHHVYDKK